MRVVVLLPGDGIGPRKPTPDLGGTATTAEFTDAVLGALTGADAVRTL